MRVCVLVFCLLTGCPLFAQGDANLVTSGDLAFENGEYERSVAFYSTYLKKDRRNCHVLYARACAYRQLENYKAALADLAICMKGPCSKELQRKALYERGMCYGWLKNFQAAKSDFDTYLKDGLDEDGLMRRADANWDLGDFRAAADDYTLLLGLKDLGHSKETLHTYRFDCFYILDSLQDALHDIQSAIDLSPSNFAYYGSRCQVHMRMDSLDLAEKDLAELKKLDVRDSLHSFLTGVLLYNRKEYAEAVPYLSKGVDKEPAIDEGALNLRAKCYYNLQQYENEIADLSRLIAVYPDDSDLYNRKGWSLIYLKRYNEALSDLNKSVAANKENSDAYDSRGCVKYFLGDVKGAIADFDMALKLYPDYGNSWFHRGLCYLALGKTDKACSDFQKAKEIGDFTVFEGVKPLETLLKESCGR